MKHIIPVLVILLLLSSGFVGVSNTVEEQRVDSEQKSTDEEYTYNRFNEHYYPEGYLSGQNPLREYDDVSSEVVLENEEKTVTGYKYHKPQQTATSGGPMDAPWPMHGHDARHTGRSPYSSVDTWDEVWRYETSGWALGSPAVDKDGTIYIGSYDFYAVNPNGTLKWEYKSDKIEHCCPAIDENGVIYVGSSSVGGYLYAINPNGTLKWKYPADSYIVASPAIDSDGVIYFAGGDSYPESGHITALYSNRTLKWRYPTEHVMYSSPAIGLDGTIYCGSHDNNVYALYPNGTLKWKYNTGSWVHGSPTIADDGTVYIGSDNGNLYAFYPNNGTIKWKINIGYIYGSLALDKDGTIYTGVWQKRFYAISPNGTIKWSFNTGNGKVWSSSPALSDDDTIYFGTCDLEWTGGIEIIALYTDGTVKWRKGLDTVFSSPAIGKDGSVYIGSCGPPGEGFLNVFGIVDLEADTNGPYYGLINEPIQFEGYSKGGYSPHSYHWDFGDGNTSDEQNPTHTYTYPSNFTVTLTVTDNSSNTSDDTTWAWIQASNDPPDIPEIDGYTSGTAGKSYPYVFETSDIDGNNIWYYIEWDDGTVTGWLGPYNSGERITKSHSWNDRGKYTIRCKAKDVYDEESDWGEFEVTMPMNQQTNRWWFLQFLQNHPRMFPIVRQLLSFVK